jgi:CRISPR-associated protein Csx17
MTHTISLPGCTPEPLMSYLKGLGAFRILAEQHDPDICAYWAADQLALSGKELDRGGIVSFFLNLYRPTPIVVPWSGNDFFAVRQDVGAGQRKKTPTGASVVESFLQTSSERLDLYRVVIRDSLLALQSCGIKSKAQMEKVAKAKYLAYLRATLPDEAVEWIDAAAIIADDKAGFSALLGSGGGSDGNTHFSDNYMQNLWEVLPDFASQRSERTRLTGRQKGDSEALLRSALFSGGVRDLASGRTSSLFDSGAVGGPNATQGFEREALTNPWNFILALEGTVCFAGAVAKRLSHFAGQAAGFPFQFRLTPNGQTSLADKEASGREIWFPIWTRPVAYSEIRQALTEGRAELGTKPVDRGVDMMRAVATLGVDRGLASFRRYAFIKGRVGGENYNTAISLWEVRIHSVKEVDFLREIDPWLNRFRAACGSDAPQRFRSALRRIESAIFDLARYGGNSRFAEILCALGEAERHLAMAGRWRTENNIAPIPILSKQWTSAANDGTMEFELALALAGINDSERKVEPIRTNLEPVRLQLLRGGRMRVTWEEQHDNVTWNSGELVANLMSILARRILDGQRAGTGHLPLSSRCAAGVDSVASFLSGNIDDSRLSELLWGLILVDQVTQRMDSLSLNVSESVVLNRQYALLKLLFLPADIVIVSMPNHRVRFAGAAETGIRVAPELRVLSLLCTGSVSQACAIAVQRLRTSGLAPLAIKWEQTHLLSGTRLAAALLIPLAEQHLRTLLNLTTESLRIAKEVSA